MIFSFFLNRNRKHYFDCETKRIVWGSKFDIDCGYIRISVNAFQRLAKELYNIFDKEKC